MALEKVRGVFDWLERVKLLYDLLAVVIGLKVAKAFLTHLTHIPSDVASAIAWLGVAMLIWVLHRFAYRPTTPAQTAQSSATLLAGNAQETLSPGIDIDRFYRDAYRSPTIEAEAHKNMRILARQKSPSNTEAFYLDIIGIGLMAAVYDTIWYPMFRSQLLALQAVNSAGLLAIGKVQEFYETAAKEFPKNYATDTFERWLSYLVSNGLVLSHPSGMVEITVRGKDFLKYLTHWGREAKSKRL